MIAVRNPWLLGGATGGAGLGSRALVCLPHLAGNAAAFGAWAGRLAPDIRVLAVQLPGRGPRQAEPPLRSIPELVDGMALALGPDLRSPYALYGHSFGALVAFELARLMAQSLGRPPEHLFVGACRPPDSPLGRAFIHDGPDEAILEYVRGMGGTPDALLAVEELRAAALPVVRADLEALETYRFAPGQPIAVPITAFGGADDPSVPSPELRGWARHTSRAFRLVTVPGGHFFLRDAADQVLETIRTTLVPSRAG